MQEGVCKYYKSLTDIELIARIIKDDSQAIEYLLFIKCKPMITRLAWQIFSNNIDQNELIGEFYLFLKKNDWAKLKTFEGSSSLCTWLTIVAMRFFIKNKLLLTNFISNHTLNINEIYDNMLTSTPHNPQDVTKYELIDAIHRLPNPKYRIVLFGELNGLSTDEIAAQLHTTICNIYNYRKRAKIELAELLNERKNV